MFPRSEISWPQSLPHWNRACSSFIARFPGCSSTPFVLTAEALLSCCCTGQSQGCSRPACPTLQGHLCAAWGSLGSLHQLPSAASPAGADAPSCHWCVRTRWSGKKASCQTLRFPKLQRESCLAPYLSGVACVFAGDGGL